MTIDGIKREIVANDNRSNFLSNKLSKYCLIFENLVYTHMEKYCKEYNGGYWLFYELSNGGFYIKIESDEIFKVNNTNNYFISDMSSDAISIGVNIFALSALFNVNHDEKILNLYTQLRNYAYEHKESKEILSFID